MTSLVIFVLNGCYREREALPQLFSVLALPTGTIIGVGKCLELPSNIVSQWA